MPILETKVSPCPSLAPTWLPSRRLLSLASISSRQLTLLELIRELTDSSEIYINENNIVDSINKSLDDTCTPDRGRLDRSQLFQMTLRGYLGLLNELFYFRYAFLQKAHLVFGVNLNCQGSFFTFWYWVGWNLVVEFCWFRILGRIWLKLCGHSIFLRNSLFSFNIYIPFYSDSLK